jgi:hypothetical protein
MPRRKLRIAIIELDSPNIPHPVEINHVNQAACATATLPAS